MKQAIIHVTVVTREDTVVDAAAQDRARAHRVVAYLRHRFPAVRYNDAPGDFDDEVMRSVLSDAPKGKVL